MENAPYQKLFCDYQNCRRNKAQVFHGVVIVLITKDLQKMEITCCIVLTNHLFWKAGHKFDISAASVRSVHLHIQTHLRQTYS